MKIITSSILIAGFCLVFKTMAAQQVELTPFMGYVLADRFSTYYGDAQVIDNAMYGLSLSAAVQGGAQIELSYERQDTKVITDNYIDDQYDNAIPLSVNYFMIGGIFGKEITGSQVVPFGGISLGGMLADGKDDWGSMFVFALGAKLGVKIFPSDKIGIRLQTQLNVPMQGVGSGIGCGIGTGGSGCGVSVSTFTTITQLGFAGGLIFRVGQ